MSQTKNKMKKIIIDHAKEQLKERDISLSDLTDCLEKPGQKVSGYRNRVIYQKILPLNGKRQVLRVVVEERKNDLKVVTVYKTSKYEKYWKKEDQNES